MKFARANSFVCDLKGNIVSGKGEWSKVAHYSFAHPYMHPQAQVCCTCSPVYDSSLLVEGG